MTYNIWRLIFATVLNHCTSEIITISDTNMVEPAGYQILFPRRRKTSEILIRTQLTSGPGSVVGIATGYRLDGPGIESRWV